MKHDDSFWNKTADKYFAQPIGDEEAYQTKLRMTREHLRPDMHVLEFGCGTGGTAIAHAPHVKHVHALDISERMLDIAKRQAKEQGAGDIKFERADIAEFDAPDGAYDAVLGMSILHLVENRDEVIEKVNRFLKPGGVFVSSTACLGDSMGWFKLVAPIGRAMGRIPLVRIFKEKDLAASLTRAGFAIEEQWRPEKSIAAFIIARKT